MRKIFLKIVNALLLAFFALILLFLTFSPIAKPDQFRDEIAKSSALFFLKTLAVETVVILFLMGITYLLYSAFGVEKETKGKYFKNGTMLLILLSVVFTCLKIFYYGKIL